MNRHALEEATAFLDSWLGYRMRQLADDIPGMSVAVWSGNKPVFSRAYGVADTVTREPLTARHRFNMASHTKMFTATAVLQLAAAGKLGLDDPACKYLPWLAGHTDKRAQEITVRQLLCHGAGLVRDGARADYWRLEAPFPDREGLHRNVLAKPLALEPNTGLKYSNIGVALLGEVIEAAGGKPWAEHVERIMRKAGMTASTPDYTPSLAGQMAAGHTLAFEGKRSPIRRDMTVGAMAPSVGVCSTAEDMCRFAAAHFAGNTALLPRTWQREMQRSQMSVTRGYDTGMAFGLGFELMRCGGRQLFGHSGHLLGQTTATWFDPAGKLAVSVLTNAKAIPTNTIVRGVFEALDHFGAHVSSPTPARFKRLQGRFYSDLAVVEVVAAGEKLLLIDPDDWEPLTWPEELGYVGPAHLRITTRGSVFNHGEDIRYRFSKGALQSVRLAGTPLLPEAAYLRQRGAD